MDVPFDSPEPHNTRCRRIWVESVNPPAENLRVSSGEKPYLWLKTMIPWVTLSNC
jgi:hypothetical protein